MIFGRHVNKYYLKFAWLYLLGIISLVVVDYFQLEIPELYQLLINGLNDGEVLYRGEIVEFNMDFVVNNICTPMLVIIMFMMIGRFLWRVCFFSAGNGTEKGLRSEMFMHAKDLSCQYYSVNKVGNLMSLFTNDLDTINECMSWGVLMLCDALFLTVFAMYYMIIMDPLLTLLSFIPMFFLLIVGVLVYGKMEKKWDERQAAFSSISDFSQESFSGIAVIKAFVKDTYELMFFNKLNKKNEKVNVEFTRFAVLLRISVILFAESVVCVILGYGGYLVWKGTFNAGQLMQFIGYFTSIVWPIMAISELIGMISRGKASTKRIGELLDAKQDVTDRADAMEIDKVDGDIEFKNLTFRYPGSDYDSLSDVSFKINAGENVGIVGKTGAGKTTVVDLLLRTHNVPDGTIFIDGRDVNSITIRSLRKFFAYVPQDNFLFSDTIKNNIAFAFDFPDDAAVENAARLSDVHSNIMGFSHGYETVLGERGVTVSGGQKQRISIARALMKESSVLILDDSVSAVDTNTEETILSNLRMTRKGKTTIFIAHRISTIEHMDKIIFINDGKVVAVGNHAELYANCPDYAKMVDLQKLEEEEK